ncbi:MAG: hypothetical protein F6J95_024220 [Leptolyngbya sp. SIO1E4]|nr:hypothetical protein [Leptolyngbya sp. SIO1E4]
MRTLLVGSLAMTLAIASSSIGASPLQAEPPSETLTAEFAQSELMSRGSYRHRSHRQLGGTGRREILSQRLAAVAVA